MPEAVQTKTTRDKTKYRVSHKDVREKRRETLAKSLNKTSREATVALRKIALADTFAQVGAKFLAGLEKLSEEEVLEVVRKKPTAAAIVSGICGQNVERLTSKPFSPTTINIDLSSAADVSRKARERDRVMKELQAKIAELQAQVRQNAIQPVVVVDADAKHNQPVLDAKTEVVDIPDVTTNNKVT